MKTVDFSIVLCYYIRIIFAEITMKIKVLTENTSVSSSLTAEHGLGLYIEAHGRKLLFDSGQSGAFAENAAAMV